MNPNLRPLAYVSPYAWIYWAVFVLVYFPEFRLIARTKPEPGKTDRSMNLILLLGWLGFPLAFALAGWRMFILARGQKAWFWLGIAFLLLGSTLRQHCFRMLGKFFTANVKVASGQTVVQEGAYRWVRHPSYTGGMMMYLGTGLGLTNWLSALVITVLGAIGYAYRVHVEEQTLQASLGQPYCDYMSRTKRFVPFLF